MVGLGVLVGLGVKVEHGLGEAVGVAVWEGEGENVADGSGVEDAVGETSSAVGVAVPSQAASKTSKNTIKSIFRKVRTFN
jgi:hypothetical protein